MKLAPYAASLAAISLAACVAPPPPPAPPTVTGVCAAAPAAFAVGQNWTEQLAESARIAANANSVRTIGPATLVTLDFRTDRLNIRVNQFNVVIEVNCS